MAFELAKAFVTVGVNSTKMKSELPKVRSQFSSAMGAMSKAAAGIGIGLGAAAVIAGIRSIASESMALAKIQIQAEARLGAVLRATSHAAGLTSRELKKFASDLQTVTTTGDEAILGIITKIATFKSITGDALKKTTELALDLAATGFGSAESAAIMLAKALEDPIRGMTAMRRVGVSFNAMQEEQIKGLVKQNRLWEAQSQILALVEKQVGGVARAMAKTTPGRIEQLEGIIGDLQEELGKKGFSLTKDFLTYKRGAYEMAVGLSRTLEESRYFFGGGASPEHYGKPQTMGESVGQLQAMRAKRRQSNQRQYAALRGMGSRAAAPVIGTATNVAQVLKGVFQAIPGVKQKIGDVFDVASTIHRGRQQGQSMNVNNLRSFGRRLMQIVSPTQFGPDAVGATTQKRMSPWNKRTSFAGLADAYQDAYLANDNPVHKTNKILGPMAKDIAKAAKAELEAPMLFAKAIGDVLSRGIHVVAQQLPRADR